MRQKLFRILSSLLILAGCATIPVVPPTEEELKIAREMKQSIAVLMPSEQAAQIKGLAPVLQTAVEKLVTDIGTANLIEREKLEKVFAEKKLKFAGITEDRQGLQETGVLLGADYLFFPEILGASLEGPEKNKYREYKNKEGHFTSGEIWDEIYGVGNINVKLIEVNSGVIIASYSNKVVKAKRINAEKYTSEASFQSALKTKRDMKTLDSASKLIRSFAGKEVKKEQIGEEYNTLVGQALEEAAHNLKRQVGQHFPLEGQVLDIISDTEVLINLGSAFGIRPGQRFIIWEKGNPVKDPATGLVTIPKRKKAILKVKEVTSGVSSIVKGSKKEVPKISVGDSITTMQ
ncbi:MAG TPA: hypothetical protein VJC03_02795 [bacterium]|nr:hypothetical protein [bacterium]